MSRKGFSRQQRLLSSKDFERVFKARKLSVSSQNLRLLAILTQDVARLGFAISKKQVPKAVQRNRMKRICRESFRHIASELPAMDIVVLARGNIAELDNNLLRDQLISLLSKLARKIHA